MTPLLAADVEKLREAALRAISPIKPRTQMLNWEGYSGRHGDGTYEDAMQSVEDMKRFAHGLTMQFDNAANMDW